MRRKCPWMLGLGFFALVGLAACSSSGGGGGTKGSPAPDDGGETPPSRWLVVLAEIGYTNLEIVGDPPAAALWLYLIGEDGSLTYMGQEQIIDRSFFSSFARHPAEPIFFAGDEGQNGNPNQLFAFAIDEFGGLSPAAGSPIDLGTFSPDAIEVDRAGGFLYASGLDDATYIVRGFEIDSGTGVVQLDADKDQGSTTYAVLAAHPTLNVLYVLGTPEGPVVSAYQVGTDGQLTGTGGSGILTGIDPSQLLITPDGRFLYAFTEDNTCSNSACTTGTVLAVDSEGALSSTGLLVQPEALVDGVVIDSEGKFVIMATHFAASSHVQVWSVDSETGALTLADSVNLPLGERAGLPVLSADEAYVYVPNIDGGTIIAFSLDRDSGELTAVDGSPFECGLGAVFAVAVQP